MNLRVLNNVRNRLTVLSVATAAALGLFSSVVGAEETITLRAVAPINPSSYVSAPIFLFKDFVEERTGGKVKVNVIGADEVVPSANQFEALQNGVVDVIVGMTSYYSGIVPEAMVLLYTKLSPAEQRESGLFDALAKAHYEKGGVLYYAHAGGGPTTAFRYYLREKVNAADFSGMKMRVSGSIRAFTEALGATPVSIPFSDVYLALERGLVDGFGTTYAGITHDALHEVTKYVLDHPIYSLNDVILLNEQTWASIPEETRKLLTDAAPEFERVVEEYNAKIMKEEDELLRSHGMELFQLSEQESKKFYSLSYSSGWEQFLKDNPTSGPALKDLSE